MTDENVLQVKVISPSQDLFTGPAISVSSKNSAGNFDILPQHANFITLIQNEPIYIRKPDRQTEMYRFPLAIMHVNNNSVAIYTNILAAASPEELLKQE